MDKLPPELIYNILDFMNGDDCDAIIAFSKVTTKIRDIVMKHVISKYINEVNDDIGDVFEWCGDDDDPLEYMLDRIYPTIDKDPYISDFMLPLSFWFQRNPGLALPLIALQYNDIKVKSYNEPLTYIRSHNQSRNIYMVQKNISLARQFIAHDIKQAIKKKNKYINLPKNINRPKNINKYMLKYR
jgi:hypothetical protein